MRVEPARPRASECSRRRSPSTAPIQPRSNCPPPPSRSCTGSHPTLAASPAPGPTNRSPHSGRSGTPNWSGSSRSPRSSTASTSRSGDDRPCLPLPHPGEPARQRPGRRRRRRRVGVADDRPDAGQREPHAQLGARRPTPPGGTSSTRTTRGAPSSWIAVWHRPLDRPQVELVASRTTGLNECFY